MKHTCTKCGHADEINPAKLLASIRTPKKEAAWKRNGEKLKQMYAEVRRVKSQLTAAPEPTMRKTMTREEMLARNMEPRFVDTVAPDISIPARPTTLEGKKAAALAALAGIKKKEWAIADEREIAGQYLHETPRAPFDVNLEGEPHRVTTMGKKLGLFYLGGGEPVFSRYLADGEFESFWERRIK